MFSYGAAKPVYDGDTERAQDVVRTAIKETNVLFERLHGETEARTSRMRGSPKRDIQTRQLYGRREWPISQLTNYDVMVIQRNDSDVLYGLHGTRVHCSYQW